MSNTTGEKTEQPTAKKLRDARKKGQIGKSKEIASAAIITGGFATLWIFWEYFINHLMEMIILPTRYLHLPFGEALLSVVHGVLTEFILLSLPVVAVSSLLCVLAFILQFGVLFSIEPIIPKLSNIDPIEGMKKIFSLSNLIELLKSLIKIIFLGILIYYVILFSLDPLIKSPYLGLPGVQMMLAAVLKRIVIFTIFAFIIIAILDYFFQKFLFIRKNRMTKEEVKREMKEMEGDPVIKSKRKHLHMEFAMNEMLQKVKTASVVITNPTRLAIALYYDKKETPLPKVLAKGRELMAQRIVKEARDAGVPIMQNIPLARNLYEQVEIDHYIPGDLIKPVAEVIKWIQKLKFE